MIGFLQGEVQQVTAGRVIVNVQGVGYIAHVTNACEQQCALQSQVSLYIHTIVREQNLDLYGFIDEQEKQLFELLITVNGIGPKVALTILSVTTIETLAHAVLSQDSSVLTKVSGIGKKNAEKILLELENKIDESWISEDSVSHSSEDLEVMEALEALGYPTKSIQEALREAEFSGMETKTKIREVIKMLT